MHKIKVILWRAYPTKCALYRSKFQRFSFFRFRGILHILCSFLSFPIFKMNLPKEPPFGTYIPRMRDFKNLKMLGAGGFGWEQWQLQRRPEKRARSPTLKKCYGLTFSGLDRRIMLQPFLVRKDVQNISLGSITSYKRSNGNGLVQTFFDAVGLQELKFMPWIWIKCNFLSGWPFV